MYDEKTELDIMVARDVMGYAALVPEDDMVYPTTYYYVYGVVLKRSVAVRGYWEWEPFTPSTNLAQALEVKQALLKRGCAVTVRSTHAMGVMAIVTIGAVAIGTYVCDKTENEAKAICMAAIRAVDVLKREGTSAKVTMP